MVEGKVIEVLRKRNGKGELGRSEGTNGDWPMGKQARGRASLSVDLGMQTTFEDAQGVILQGSASGGRARSKHRAGGRRDRRYRGEDDSDAPTPTGDGPAPAIAPSQQRV